MEKVRDFAEGLPESKGVYSDLSQCFSNLIKNALRESSHKKLVVRTGWNEHFIFVGIIDSGCGIRKEDLLNFVKRNHLGATEGQCH